MFTKLYATYAAPGLNRLAHVIVPEGRVRYDMVAVVIGSNLTNEDLEQAKNEDLVKKAQEILQSTTQPAWYRYRNP
jgi:mitochondrial fission protein ELM1